MKNTFMPHVSSLVQIARPLTLAAALLGLSQAGAQSAQLNQSSYLGANITRQYDIDDLTTRPGLLTLGKGDMMILDFPADVVAVMTPQAAMLDVPDPLGNVAVITGKVSSGTAQVMVQLDNGKYATFVITLTPGGNGIKRIKIANPAPLDYSQPSATNTQSAAVANQMPAYKAPTGTPLIIPNPGNVASSVRAGTPTSTAAFKGPAPLPTINAPQPTWLNMSTQLSGSSLVITVRNGGTRPVTLNASELRLLEGGSTGISSNLQTNLTVAANETKSVTLTLDHAAQQVQTIWYAHDSGANMTYTLTN